jgi:phenylacetate-CoA ligase
MGNYHVQSENVLLEIVDDQGQPCAAGEPGQVLITTVCQ